MSNGFNGTGIFVTLEGPEGAGKTTLQKQLVEYFNMRSCTTLAIREPGGTELGETIREMVKYPKPLCEPTPMAELMLFAAARTQLLSKVIVPAIGNDTVVICDRFADSTTAYQGYGRGIDLRLIKKIHEVSVDPFWPDLTILLDIDSNTMIDRINLRVSKKNSETANRVDIFEDATLEFHKRVRNGYLQIAEDNDDLRDILVVDASGTPDEVFESIIGSDMFKNLTDRAINSPYKRR